MYEDARTSSYAQTAFPHFTLSLSRAQMEPSPSKVGK